MTQVIAIGECMVELTGRGEASLAMGFAGDTYNTAVYLKRLADEQMEVRYLTATGDDWLSEAQLASMRSEGIVVDAQRVPGASPALYLVSTDDRGERSFTYYRDASPVRHLFDGATDPILTDRIRGAGLIYFSAVTLQLLTRAGREALFRHLTKAREHGGIIAFDSNYRPRGWASADAAREAIGQALRVTDIGLPSLDDERMLHGGDAEDVIGRYRAAGVTEVVVKDGPHPVTVWSDGASRTFSGAAVENPVDTTGAGDSFNAGYLHARLSGRSVPEAVRQGQHLSGVVITRPGAIIDAGLMPTEPLHR